MLSTQEGPSSPLCKVYYRPIEAAIRWSGLHRHEPAILNTLRGRQTPTAQDFPRWPALRLNAERIYDAILNDELPHGRNGITTRSAYRCRCDGSADRIDQGDVTVRHLDLRTWMQRCYPSERPRFLFTAAERATHPVITVEAGQALLTERAALHALLRQCQQHNRILQASYNGLLARQSAAPAVAPAPAPDLAAAQAPSGTMAISHRADTTYLNIIGALLALLLGDAPSGKPYSAFRTQEAIISAMLAHHGGLMGLTERTLQSKFAQAKRQVAARHPPPAQGRMCGPENRICGVQAK